MTRSALLCALLVLTSACGGGGGSPPASPLPPPPTPPPSVILNPANLTLDVAETAATPSIEFDVAVTGFVGAFTPDVVFDATRFALDGPIAATASGYHVKLKLIAERPFSIAGDLTFRLCGTATCADVFAGSSRNLPYKIDALLAPWRSWQRGSDHNAYVPITLDATKITEAWRWTGTGSVLGLAADAQAIYVTHLETINGASTGYLSTHNPVDGTVARSTDFGAQGGIGAPAISGPNIVLATSGLARPPGLAVIANKAWGVTATTGAVVFSRDLVSDTEFGVAPYAPTPAGDRSFLVESQAAGGIVAIDSPAGALAWRTPYGSAAHTYAAATVSGDNVLIADGVGVSAFSQASGAFQYRIQDPLRSSPPVFNQYGGGPVLGAMNDALVFSGGSVNGALFLPPTSLDQRIVSYDLNSRSVKWTSSAPYMGPLLAGDGVVYAGDNNAHKVVALDERDGHVLWTWAAPPPKFNTPYPNSMFVGIATLTRSHLFVATHDNLYAINLSTHQSDWSFGEPGFVYITPTGLMLINPVFFDAISQSLRAPQARIVALRLR